MKILIGVDFGSYTFNATAKTITLVGLNPVALEQVLLITNVNTNAIIYQFNKVGYGATIAANVLTLDCSTTGMSNADSLQIFIDYESTLSTAANQVTEIASLASIDAGIPAALGQVTMVNSMPVVIASNQTAIPVTVTGGGDATAANQTALNTLTGAVTETAPATDTASSGLNGRLQRMAQRITSLIAALGSPLQAGGSITTGGLTDAQIRATPLPVTTQSDGVVSVVNSTIVNLAAGAVFTGTSEDLTIYSNIKVSVFSSHTSATDGLSMQQSSDGTNWDSSDVYSIPAATYRTFSVGVHSRFFRIVYTNGGILTTSLRIQVLYHKSDKQPSSVRPQDARSNDNDFVETLGFLMGYNGTSWDRLRSSITNGLQVDVMRLPTKATYRASTVIPLIAATTVNVPFFNIIGSATKTVTIKKITVSGMTLTAVGYFAINVEKLSTASTAGTSTTLTATALDSTSAAVTAVVKAYTVAPTKGALVGTLRCFRSLWQATVASATGVADQYDFNFSENQSTGVVLRGVAQELALTFPVVLSSAGTLSICCEWTEE